jgi:peptide subunit release factor 1 (eRF1)
LADGANRVSGPTAGYVDAAPVIAGTLRELATLRPPVPVLSLYLDLDPSEFGTQPARRSAVTSLLDTAHKRIEDYDTDHRGRGSLRADLERATAFFDEFSPKGSRGAAIFAASAAGVFRPYLLPRPTPTRVVIDDSPFILPLARAADLRDWLIVLVDTRNARLMHGNTDHIEEIERVKDNVPGRHEQAGPSDHQRHVEKAVDVHLEHVARELDAQLATGGYERVILGGPSEILPRLESSHMSNPARAQIAGHIEVEVPKMAADEVRRAATPVFEKEEAHHEHELLERLTARLARGEGAVAGLDDVRDALVQRRVQTLLYDERDVPTESALESAIEEAVVQSAAILPVRHTPEALDQHGHIAAILRF